MTDPNPPHPKEGFNFILKEGSKGIAPHFVEGATLLGGEQPHFVEGCSKCNCRRQLFQRRLGTLVPLKGKGVWGKP